MSKRINSYQAVAAFVRGFFEAYARGIIDATIDFLTYTMLLVQTIPMLDFHTTK